MKRILAGAAILAALSPLYAQQSTINFYSSTAKAGQPLPKECLQQADVLKKNLAVFPHPSGWTYYIVCDDMAWQKVMIRLDAGGVNRQIYGETNFSPDVHLTYLRGAALINAQADRSATPEHIIAHELGHIYLKSTDENKVDALAAKWVSEFEKSQVAAK